MSKGEQTREMILQQAALVFNRQGYFGTSLADIMRATGLEKGGIYNHFESKDALALEAFDYAVEQVNAAYREAMQGKRNTVERLMAIVGTFRDMAQDSLLPGGCPVVNTAVEADDAHPLLRERARRTMEEWHSYVRRTVARGIEKGEIRPETNPDGVATILIATLEGGVIMNRLHSDNAHINLVVDHLTGYLQSVAQP